MYSHHSHEANRLKRLYDGLKSGAATRSKFVFQGKDRFWYQRYHPKKKTISVFHMGAKGFGRYQFPVIMGGSPGTYYLREDGTAANKEAASGPGSTQSACMPMDVQNSETFAAGDDLLLCDDGGVFYPKFSQDWQPPSAGTQGSLITYKPEPGDSPIIDSSRAVTSWSESAGETDVWEATLGDDPGNLVIIDGSIGTEKASAAACTSPGDWYWASSLLQVYDTSSPTDVRTPAGILHGFYILSQNYIRVEDLTFRYSNVNGVRVMSSVGCELVGLTIQYSSQSGVNFNNGTGSDLDMDGLLEGCTITGSLNGGAVLMGGVNRANNVTVQDNIITDNVASQSQGDCIRFSAGDDCTLLRNFCKTGTVVSGNADGIDIAEGHNTLVAYNVIVGGADVGDGLSVKTDSSGTEVYNNVIYFNGIAGGNGSGIWETGALDTIYKNNIVVGTSNADVEFKCIYIDGLEDNITSENNLYRNEKDASKTGRFDGADKTWAQWQAGGFDASGVNADPSWVDPTNDDFHLKSDSPCIEAGLVIAALTLDKDRRLLGRGINPDIGAFETLKGGPRAL